MGKTEKRERRTDNKSGRIRITKNSIEKRKKTSGETEKLKEKQ